MAYEYKTGGRIDDKWTLLHPLGQGANGEVWRALHDDGMELALKLSWYKREHDRGKRFRDEVKTHQRVEGHPGILPMYDFSLPLYPTVKAPSWLSMPEATRIRDKLGDPSQLEMVVEAMASIAETLAWLAQKRIFHRDIKPDNLYWYEGRWVIGDLGLATFPGKEQLTTPSRPAAPANSIPPELLRDAEHAEPAPADVQLAAKTLWRLATGLTWAPPGLQRVGMRFESMEQHLIEQGTPHPRVRLLDNLIQRASDNDPAKRPTMAEFAKELRLWLMPPIVAPGVADLSQSIAEARAMLEPAAHQRELHNQWYQQGSDVLAKFDQQLQPFMGTVTVQGLSFARSRGMGTQQIGDQLFNPSPSRNFAGVGVGGRTLLYHDQHHYEVQVGNQGQILLCGVRIVIFNDGYANLLVGHYIFAGQSRGLYCLNHRTFYLASPEEDPAISELVAEFQNTFPAAFGMAVKLLQEPATRLPDLFPPPDPQYEQQRRQTEQRLQQAARQLDQELVSLNGQTLFASNILSLCGRAPKADTSTLVWSASASTYRSDTISGSSIEPGFGAELYDDNQLYLIAAVVVSGKSRIPMETPWERKVIVAYDTANVEQTITDLTADLITHLPAAITRFCDIAAMEKTG